VNPLAIYFISDLLKTILSGQSWGPNAVAPDLAKVGTEFLGLAAGAAVFTYISNVLWAIVGENQANVNHHHVLNLVNSECLLHAIGNSEGVRGQTVGAGHGVV